MTRCLLRLLPVTVAGLTILISTVPGWAQEPAKRASQEGAAVSTSQRLASVLTRYANEVMVSTDLNVGGMNVALALLQESTRLDPEHPATWRKLIELALAMDREDLLDDATRNLLLRVPDDQGAQLERLLAALARFNTADERIAALEQLLEPETSKVLGPELSARLAFRLADLHRRRGDMQAFGHWLRESIAMDPTYSDAVGIATGFLRDRVPDHVAYVELLLGLLTADLTDDDILATLNAYLLAGGAYESAERMIHMRMDQMAARGTPAGSQIYQDLALAQWGQGKHDEALQTISTRREMLNRVYEALAKAEDPSKSPLELAQLKAPLPPRLAAIQAMLLVDEEDVIQGQAIEDLVLSVDFEEGLSDIAAEQGRNRATRLLHAFWMLVWLDADEDLLATRLAQIVAIEDLSELAKERIEAWKLLRAGDAAGAEALFRKDATGHMLTQAGLAKALIAQGQSRDAAELLLAMWNSQQHQMTGLWARDQLEKVLGVPVPPSAEAVRMNELVAEIPLLLDRVPGDPRLALSLRIRPTEDSYKPYDPILIEVEISNNTPLPLAIDEDGPIQDLLLLQGDVRVPYADSTKGPSILVEIVSRLRLMPFESMTIPIDLRRYWVGTVIDRHPLYGATVDLTGIINFRMTTGITTGKPSHIPGLMGIETDLNDIRIDGQRVTKAWASRVIGELGGEEITPEELVNIALLTHVISSNTGSLVSDPLPDEIINAGVDMIIDTYPKLDSVSRAWLLAAMARSPRLDPIWDMAERSDDVTVHLIQLMRLYDSAREMGSIESLLEDSVVISALNSDLPEVRYLAEWVEDLAQMARDYRLKILTGEDGAGG